MDGVDDWRIADGYTDVGGTWHATDDDARSALRSALGDPPGPEETSTWFVRAGTGPGIWSPGVVELEDGAEVAVEGHLPDDLPLGVHRLHSEGGHLTRVFVVPARVTWTGRTWGWALQTHGAVGERSWGIGDLEDLRDVAERSAACGAGVVASSPLGAPVPVPPVEPSPYFPSSRRHLSLLFVRVEEVPGAELVADQIGRAAAAGRELSARPTIDRDAVWRLKRDALGAVWEASRPPVALGDLPEGLVHQATFDALAEHHGGGRDAFPVEHAHPDAPGVGAWRDAHADQVSFWAWVQLELDRQLARVAAVTDLVVDLPVGFDPDGADAWRDQDLLADGCRIGAPPDEFNRAGQDWGLPPYVPWRLRAEGYRAWIETLRAAFRHASAVRIDHVVGLSRLYCIPPGHDARHGAYVRQFHDELLDVACLEAARAGATVVGEDLGTVEDAARAAMSERGVAGYRIAWFESAAAEDWPSRSVAMLTTHDLPTVAGIWTGTDESDRTAAGLPPAPAEAASLRDRLAVWAGVDPTADGSEVLSSANRRLWASGSDLALFTAEDAVGDVHRPNLPGTRDEHPNWRRRLPGLRFADAPPEGTGPAGSPRPVRS